MSLKAQRGLTLIELMIVVFLMSILVAIAIPSYSIYTTRSKITEGFALASVVQRLVEEYHHVNGIFPSDNVQAGVGAPGEHNGSYVSSISVEANGVIQVEFDDPSLAGGQLILSPSVINQSIEWECSSPNITTALLPKECR